MEKRLKLVRDYIPNIIKENGEVCKYHIASRNEYQRRLYEKMREELDEFIDTPCVEEAGDMYEVLRAICELHELDMYKVGCAADDKRERRGGFSKRIVLESAEDPEDDWTSTPYGESG